MTTPPSSPSLADFAARINTEFAAIQKADYDGNRNVVTRAIGLGRTLCQAKDKLPHGKWGKWLADYCGDISVCTAQRYMTLADSQAVRDVMGKNDTVSLLSLRAALALANRKPGQPPDASTQYDRAEGALVKKLEALLPDTAEAAVSETIGRLTETVARIKTKTVRPAA
jgi:hypothetical protein